MSWDKSWGTIVELERIIEEQLWLIQVMILHKKVYFSKNYSYMVEFLLTLLLKIKSLPKAEQCDDL